MRGDTESNDRSPARGNSANAITKGNIRTMQTYSPSELAKELNSDGKTVRRFLRSVLPDEAHPGKGNRWALQLDANGLDKVRARFAAWNNKTAQVISIDAFDTDDAVDEDDTLDA